MFNRKILDVFRSVSTVEAMDIINSSPNKTHDLCPLLICRLKKCAHQRHRLKIAIFNGSMVESVMPLFEMSRHNSEAQRI